MADALDDVAGLLRSLFVGGIACGIVCAVLLCAGSFVLGRHAWQPRTSFASVRVEAGHDGDWTELWGGKLADVPCSNGVYTIVIASDALKEAIR